MPEIEVDIEIWCSCGEGLCNQSSVKKARHGNGFVVEPCQKCLDRAEAKGYDSGFDDASRRVEN
jgi:hypothetical protein